MMPPAQDPPVLLDSLRRRLFGVLRAGAPLCRRRGSRLRWTGDRDAVSRKCGDGPSSRHRVDHSAAAAGRAVLHVPGGQGGLSLRLRRAQFRAGGARRNARRHARRHGDPTLPRGLST